MPRVNGVMQLPPGSYGVPGQPIESAKYNTVIDDFTADANNPRPISAGGTGGATIAAALAALNAVQQGGGAGQLGSKVFLGWSGLFLKAQVDGTDLGRVWTDFEAPRSLSSNSGYQKFPGGVIVQWGSATGADATVTFPVSFPIDALPIIIPGVFYNSTGTAEAPTAFISFRNSSSFTFRPRFASNGGAVAASSAFTINWIAIGR